MKIGRQFNELTVEEYCYFIEHYKKYDDFNTLGLYRSIIENNKLELADKIYVRDIANKTFEKTFNFLQLKDPKTYFDLTTLGQELTEGDERKAWDDIRKNQEKILADKRIKHRNFGVYSKHDCGFYNCPCPGIMIKKGSRLKEDIMIFDSDINKYGRKAKSKRVKKDRKREGEIIRAGLGGGNPHGIKYILKKLDIFGITKSQQQTILCIQLHQTEYSKSLRHGH